ncbi:MAG TPA: A/G-specific adenine glycosylase [Steroidobacteraceae bacterium]|jgi:A/G-specific adenine glycosylase|nr:A/G-specific adenine glycosylase [Steroidobacteraceae bacterium]
MTAPKPPLAPALLAWHQSAGRHDLPWQIERTPYRVWVSEIMLQQTQVGTAAPYYRRFLARFPDVNALAAAPIDEVLHLWSGLGYYARARNLHRAALRLREEHAGEFPRAFAQIVALPGIGRSTAGAILALAREERYPILDGNARRVLARYFGVAGAANDTLVRKRLWQLAEEQTPALQVAAYTQAIMDLGATVCVRRRPLCSQCPLESHCSARRSGRQHEIPAPRRASARPKRDVFMVVALKESGAVLLERRPESGVWGGLWCLPEFATASAAGAFIRNSLGAYAEPQPLDTLEHGFTHFDLAITPLLVRCSGAAAAIGEGDSLWYNIRAPARIGLPAPITTLLSGLAGASLFDAATPH